MAAFANTIVTDNSKLTRRAMLAGAAATLMAGTATAAPIATAEAPGQSIGDEARLWVQSHADYIAHLLEKTDGGAWRTAVDLETGFVMVLKDFSRVGGRP